MNRYICDRCKNTSYSASADAPCPYCDSDLKKYERTTRIWAVIAILLVILALAVTAGLMG